MGLDSQEQKPEDVLQAAMQRRLEKRQALCQNAVVAAGRIASSGQSVPKWFPELAPLTKAERALVARAVAAGMPKE